MRPTATKSTKFARFLIAATVMSVWAGGASAHSYLKLGAVAPGSDTAKTREAAARIDVGQPIEVQAYSWGATQGSNTPIKVGQGRIAAADYDGDGRADRVIAPRDAATGMASGKQQHNPSLRGSVTVTGNFSACTVGASYSDAILQAGDMLYQLHGVVVTACGSPGAGQPTNSLTASYLHRKLL